MNHSTHQSPSLRQRMRLMTTATCVLTGMVGLWSLASNRPVHGVLALAASVLLLQGSVWGRKARRARVIPTPQH